LIARRKHEKRRCNGGNKCPRSIQRKEKAPDTIVRRNYRKEGKSRAEERLMRAGGYAMVRRKQRGNVYRRSNNIMIRKLKRKRGDRISRWSARPISIKGGMN
jgi:hypothetical protein